MSQQAVNSQAVNRHVVFVYGSLKRDESNNFYMASGDFLCRAKTPCEFRIYNLGRYPTMARTTHEPLEVVGEVYRVDDDTLAALDKLEQNGELYQREVIRVLSRDVPGETLEAWAYLHLGDATVFPLWPNDCWTGR